jgi:PBP1b-binding outer membrane lipoprotein LpoB
MHYRILSSCFICLFFAACSEKEKTEVVNTEIINIEVINTSGEVKIVPDKTVQQKAGPALNLSIETISIDLQKNNKDIFNGDKKPIDTHSETFIILNRDQSESNTKLSGTMFTDQEKIDNEEYLDSLDGVQINVEGSF